LRSAVHDHLPDHLYEKGGEEFPELMKETEKDCLAAGPPGVAPAVSPLLKGETLRVLVPQLCNRNTPFAHFHQKKTEYYKQLETKYITNDS
jgi:hypothetical protein